MSGKTNKWIVNARTRHLIADARFKARRLGKHRNDYELGVLIVKLELECERADKAEHDAAIAKAEGQVKS